jgi:hypothetical protein
MLGVYPNSQLHPECARSRHRLCRVLAETEFIGVECLPCIALATKGSIFDVSTA